jgi:hydrogenase maturation protease
VVPALAGVGGVAGRVRGVMLTIIGCGNPNRSDDGAGVAVAQRLLSELGRQPRAGVQVFDTGTSGIEVMFKARGSSELVLVDACSSQSEPGAVFEVPGHLLERVPEPAFNLHGLRWDHALHAGKKIFREEFPEQVTVYLIEKLSLDLGIGLSPVVERAVTIVVERILARVRAGCSAAASA